MELFLLLLLGVSAVAFVFVQAQNRTAARLAALSGEDWTAPREVVVLIGRRGRGFEIVGEASYQDAISDLVGGHQEGGVNCPCDVVISPEPENRFDAGAIVVRVDGERVGYIARGQTDAFRAELARLGLAGQSVMAPGEIVGGWDDGDDDVGDFGVRMTIRPPFEIVRSDG